MSTHRSSPARSLARLARRLGRDEGGQSLPVVLTLITFLFIIASAMAAHASVALRTTSANEAQGGDLHAASAGVELGMWWQRSGKSGDPPDISVNGKNVSTTVSMSGGSACPSRTPVAIRGFESGALSTAGAGLFSAITGNGVTIDSTVVRSGAHSLRIAVPNGSRHNATINSAGGSLAARLYLRLDTLPTKDATELLVLDAVAGNDLRLGYQLATQRLTLRFGSLAVTTASSTISAGTWVRIDILFTANASPRTASWLVDGVAQADLSSTGAASTVRSVRLGSNVNADVYTANYDDVVTSATAGDFPIGDGAVLPLRPDGMGTSSTPASFHHDDGSAVDATTHLRLNDDPMTSTAGYVQQDVAGATSYVETTLSDTTATCIAGVSGLVAYHAKSSSANRASSTIVDGATERVIFTGDMSETGLFYRSAIIPPTGSWTRAAVNALRARVGYGTDVSPAPAWDALLLEVATASSMPGTVTVIASAGASTVTAVYPDAGSATPVLESWTASR